MAQSKFQFVGKGNFIRGGFRKPQDGNGEWISKSPANFSDVLGKFQYSYADVDEAVISAREAFRSWKNSSFESRASCLKKYQAVIKRREDELAEAIAREVGKPLWEAKGEVATMISKVDITLTESMKYVADFEIQNIMENTDGSCRYKPLGVLAVIGPFNFPAHLPNGHFVPALVTGNTIVFKPSEKTPLVGQLLAECFHEAGLPPGVFNLVQGEKEVGRRLCVHEGLNGILFTGSYEVGTRIKQDTLQQHWKLVALEMGGKNPAIVWDDADLNTAIYECLLGAFLTTGQRCSATSRIIVHKRVLPEFVERFHERAKAFTIGHPLENPFMGSLIDQTSVDRYMKFLGIAGREGCEILMRGKALELPVQGNYVTPSICLANDPSIEHTRKSVFQQSELFAPNVVILGCEELDEAIEQANATQYGLAASVFTKNRETYNKCWQDLEMGIINWNKSTSGASSRLPFGGLKKSGNHFPTAVTSPTYCTYPVASLETSEIQTIEKLVSKAPGLNWK